MVHEMEPERCVEYYVPCATSLTAYCSFRAAGLLHYRNQPDRFDYLRTKYVLDLEAEPPMY